MSVIGTCKRCGGETSDYECLRCTRRLLEEVLAALRRAVQEDHDSKRPDHYTRLRYAYDVIAKANDIVGE